MIFCLPSQQADFFTDDGVIETWYDISNGRSTKVAEIRQESVARDDGTSSVWFVATVRGEGEVLRSDTDAIHVRSYLAGHMNLGAIKPDEVTPRQLVLCQVAELLGHYFEYSGVSESVSGAYGDLVSLVHEQFVGDRLPWDEFSRLVDDLEDELADGAKEVWETD